MLQTVRKKDLPSAIKFIVINRRATSFFSILSANKIKFKKVVWIRELKIRKQMIKRIQTFLSIKSLIRWTFIDSVTLLKNYIDFYNISELRTLSQIGKDFLISCVLISMIWLSMYWATFFIQQLFQDNVSFMRWSKQSLQMMKRNYLFQNRSTIGKSHQNQANIDWDL